MKGALSNILTQAWSLATSFSVVTTKRSVLHDFHVGRTEGFGWGIYLTDVTIDHGDREDTLSAFCVREGSNSVLTSPRGYYTNKHQIEADIGLQVGQQYLFTCKQSLLGALGLTSSKPRVVAIAP